MEQEPVDASLEAVAVVLEPARAAAVVLTEIVLLDAGSIALEDLWWRCELVLEAAAATLEVAALAAEVDTLVAVAVLALAIVDVPVAVLAAETELDDDEPSAAISF